MFKERYFSVTFVPTEVDTALNNGKLVSLELVQLRLKEAMRAIVVVKLCEFC